MQQIRLIHLAGSYFIERLTDEMERAAWKLIEKIDAMGGSVAAIEQGFMQNEIADSAYNTSEKWSQKEKIIVGVNSFIIKQEGVSASFRIDDAIRAIQVQKLEKLRSGRNNEKVSACLKKINDHATNNENLMPSVIDAVENYCTLGEIADTLRRVFGEYKQS